MKIAIISHAGIKQINRAVYRKLAVVVDDLKIIVPESLKLGSGKVIAAEPRLKEDPEIVPLHLKGRNPRTYTYPALISFLNTYKPDILLLENDPVSQLGFVLSGWCRKNNAHIICQTYENTRRGFISTLKSQGWRALPKNMLIHLMNKLMSARVSAVLVVNNESESIFNEYRYSNVTKIPLGYDPGVFFVDEQRRSAYRAKLGIGTETVLVAYFGRMVKQKGIHLIVQALYELKEMDWRLLLDGFHDGDKEYAAYLRALVDKLGLTNRVIYFEADHFEIAAYMRASDIMVAASITTPMFKEQYGRAVQEAMACGCACVVSDSGHLKDLVQNAEVVFKEGNIVMLRQILQHLISDKHARSSVARQQHQRANEFLTIENQVQGVFGLIKHLKK